MAGQIGTGSGVGYIGSKFMYDMRAAPTVTVSGVNLWNPAQGWKAVTSTAFGNTQVGRGMHVLYDNTYSSFTNNWALLVYGTWYLDARL